VVLPKGVKLAADADADGGAGMTRETLEERLRAVEPRGTSRSATYERVGDTMIAPWSIDLGPVGLMPVKAAAAEQVVGEWIGADGRTITVRAPAKDGPLAPLLPSPLVFGRPEGAWVERMISELTFQPDARGISMKVYGWNCGMGHMDLRGLIYSFTTADQRLVRITYPAMCARWPQDPRPIEIFHRAPARR
jgi:hypothetical protein